MISNHYKARTHYTDVIMSAIASQITGVSNACSKVCSGANQRKHQSSAVTGGLPSQRTWNEENVSIWWRQHAYMRNSRMCHSSYLDTAMVYIITFWHSSYTSVYVIMFFVHNPAPNKCYSITHWGRVTHICVCKLIIIGSDNGLSPGRRQAIIWTIAGIFLIGPLGKNFSEIWTKIQNFSFMKMRLKMSSGKWRPFRLGLCVISSHHAVLTLIIVIHESYLATVFF